MRLSLWLLLPALIPSSQEICSAPGALLAPILHLNQTSAQPGDSVRVKCFMLSQDQVTRVFFCKEREEVSSQRGSKEKATYDYDHVVSRESSGNYSCGYEMKDKNNQVTRSQLSPAKHLSITGDDSSSGSGGADGSLPPGLDLKLLLGITVPTFLLLAVVLYLLGKKAGSLWREHRERVQHDTSSALEKHTEYTSKNWPGKVTLPLQAEENPTYMNVALQRGRYN
ncbi:uncharacterized protein LOC112545205 [Pelodiscus sinensis]|uniref:uncharacterized protein LOC112545205 n=1 Tax=Pelodiscus sinensis TaxID=13735 RepID=UPI003F6B301D